MFKNKTLLFGLAILGVSFSSASLSSASWAAGFSSSFSPFGGTSAKALAQNYSNLQSGSGYVRTNNYAEVKTETIGNQVIKGIAEAGNKNVVVIDGDGCGPCGGGGKVSIDQQSVAKTKVFVKNKNILAKAYAKNTLKVKVSGKLVFENEEYAAAMGRFTPLGTQVKSIAINHNKLEAKGFVRLESGNIAVSSGQIGNN